MTPSLFRCTLCCFSNITLIIYCICYFINITHPLTLIIFNFFRLLREQMALIVDRQIVPFEHIVLLGRPHPYTRRPIFRNPFVLCPAIWIAHRHGLDPLIIRHPCGNTFKTKSAFTPLRNHYPWNHQDFTEKFVPALITCDRHAIYTLVRHTPILYNIVFRY